jgi:acetyl esterase
LFSVNTYDPLTTDLVLRTGFALVFPEYTRAPEAKWPQQQEQVFEVLDWIVKNGESKGLDAGNFAVVSDSAAGRLYNISAWCLEMF